MKLVAMLSLAQVLSVLIPTGAAESPRQGEQRRGISFVCARTSSLPGEFGEVVSSLLRRYGEEGVAKWGDRAVAVELGGPPGPEYLVPLSCGATGNCTWGILADHPPRSVGITGGAFVIIRPKEHGWAEIESFSSYGAGEGGWEVRGYLAGVYRRKSVAKLTPEGVGRYSPCVDNEKCCL